MGLSRHQLDVLNKAGMLHDIGKVSTPRAILDKPANSRMKNMQLYSYIRKEAPVYLSP